MMKKLTLLLVVISLIACEKSDMKAQEKSTEKSKEISMFPEAKNGFKRLFIALEPRENENDFQIEMYAGKIYEVDCNNFSLMGQFLEQNLEGWGYNYYEFETNGQLRGTLMACPEDTKEEKFVISSPIKVRYNSKLPIVVYVPIGYDIKYKIWSKGAVEFNAVEN